MKIVSIVGARPQFIKAAAFSREVRQSHQEILVHTGQHYDYQMSGIFFDGLEMAAPDINLEVGSGSHGAQTGAMLARVEEVLVREKPDWVVIYGDTNSTLAGALAAAKLSIPIAHVEAGLRSFNRQMPEEVNRVMTDHLSSLLLCPSAESARLLAAEGILKNVHVVGDIMRDVLNWACGRLCGLKLDLLARLGVKDRKYLAVTVHRGENTDARHRLSAIVEALNSLREDVVFPVHPRTRKAIQAAGHKIASHIKLIEPLGYLEMMQLSGSARLVLTDSGGLQKEAYWLGVPCVTLRDETEWVETVTVGWNTLTGASFEKIIDAVRSFSPPVARPSLYGEGTTAAECVSLLNHR